MTPGRNNPKPSGLKKDMVVARMLQFRIPILWLIVVLPVLTACSTKRTDYNSMEAASKAIQETRESNQELMDSINKLRNQSKDIELSDDMFRRKMTLSFESNNKQLTRHQQKVINLFFQTLPRYESISIIISVAPASSEGFDAVHSAWARVQALKNYLKAYSDQIEELYLPDESPDSVTIQVLGGKGV